MAHQPREHFLGELARLETQALGGLDLVCESLDRVLEAVQHCDIELAEMVIADDDRIDGRYLEVRSEEHTSELQPHDNLVCRLPLEKKRAQTLTAATGSHTQPRQAPARATTPR